MSSLNDVEKRYFEALFGMRSGYVLDYTDATFGELFKRHGINIHSSKYTKYGKSKAKKLRAFWEIESDHKVADVLSEMLEAYVVSCELSGTKPDEDLLNKCRKIVRRLGTARKQEKANKAVTAFLKREFAIPNLSALPLEKKVINIVEERLREARKALEAGAYLSVILLSGSILEAVLLGAARAQPERFNRAPSSPRGKDGRVRPFHEWSLSQLIDVAHDIGLLSLDVKKFSHGLRDFRNFIHPYEQVKTGFTPDQHTAKIYFQVLKAALAEMAGMRE